MTCTPGHPKPPTPPNQNILFGWLLSAFRYPLAPLHLAATVRRRHLSLRIPYNRPCFLGTESDYILDAVKTGHLSGNGEFGRRCTSLLTELVGCQQALLTPSCTAALEMATLLVDLEPGDEVIMPSFTFVATATAVVLRGAVPVFVDIREDTLNIDESLVEAAITPRTKAIVVVHYAGVGCEMNAFTDIAARHGLVLIEDAAQGILARYRGQPLGGIGTIGAMSFHETKNIHCGEGGALLLNDERHRVRAEILQEKGTNRSQFFRGEVDKYTWVDLGSSYLVSDVTAAFLAAQLERASDIITDRLQVWNTFHTEFARLEGAERLRRPVVPDHCEHNGHIYYLLLPDLEQRTAFIQTLADRGIHAVFHYVPLHASPAGRRYGRVSGEMSVTVAASDRLVRLPLWWDMPDDNVARIIDAVSAAVATPV